MFRIASNALSFLLLGVGAGAWALTIQPLAHDPDTRIPTNPLGLKRSPYGEVLAMAMQSPINLVWHSGVTGHEHHHHAPGEPCEEELEHEHDDEEEASPKLSRSGPLGPYQAYLDELNGAAELRTNPKSATAAHRFAMRRKVEDQLRFAYELDPSHYGNYTAYHFFLTQSDLGTRPELTRQAMALTEETIRYCLSRNDDPRPALTAAAAIENELLIFFQEPARHPLSEMRRKLELLDTSLARHRELREQWTQSGNWNLISSARRDEMDERYRFTLKLRDAADSTIQRLAKENGTPSASGPPPAESR
ncbi:MAG TPA: hypothetical protein VIM57_11305 [Luteolibacter sp.]